MPNVLEVIFGKALNDLIVNISKNIEEQIKNKESEKKHEELKKGSIDVEFTIKKED